MAINREKVEAAAIKLLQQGKYDKAIAELKKLVDDDKNDVRTLLKIGDTYIKMGSKKDAIASYERAASIYAEQGFFLKAVAVYKQVIRVDANIAHVQLRLAELYQQLGLSSDALQHYQNVAVAYEQGGRARDALDILKRMVELDPDNIASRIKLGEMFAQQGLAKEAKEELLSALQFLKQQQRMDDYVRVGERLVSFDSTAIEVARELAQIYMQRGQPSQALAKLQLCFKIDQRNVDVLELIAQAFLQLEQTAKTVSIYKELAKIHLAEGRDDQSIASWERVVALVPDDGEAQEALGRAPARPATPAAAKTAPAPAAKPASAPATPKSPEDEQLQRLLTETDVYVKYGLKDKALDNLQKAFSIRPSYIPALEKLKNLQQGLGGPELVATLQRLVASAEDQGHARLEEWRAELARAELRARSAATSPAPPSPARVAAPSDDGDEFILVDDPPSVLRTDDPTLGYDLAAGMAPLKVLAASQVDEEPSSLGSSAAESQALRGSRTLGNDDDSSFDPDDDSFAAKTGANGPANAFESSSDFENGVSAQTSAMRPGAARTDENASPNTVPTASVPGGGTADGDVDRPDPPAAANTARTLGGAEQAARARAEPPAEFSPDDDDADFGERTVAIHAPVAELRVVAELRAANPRERAAARGSGAVAVPASKAVEDMPAERNEASASSGNEFESAPSEEFDPASFNLPSEVQRILRQDADDATAGVQLTNPRAASSALATMNAGEPSGEGQGGSDLAGQLGVGAKAHGWEEDSASQFFHDELNEAEFFIKQDLLDEATEILSSILEEVPDSGRVRWMLARIEAREKGTPEPPAPWEQRIEEQIQEEMQAHLIEDADLIQESQEGSFAAESTSQLSVDSVLSQFKKGGAEAVPEEDGATHFELGVAYREMGLHEDAVAELQLAGRAPGHAAEARYLIGLVRKDQGQLEVAVKAFEEALAMPTATSRQRGAFEYERGVCLQELGRFLDALRAFKAARVLGNDAADLERRIQVLTEDVGAGEALNGNGAMNGHAGDPSVPRRSKNADYA